jgi:ADP-ribose pyrophosphatase YjhB (NUDIX family)
MPKHMNPWRDGLLDAVSPLESGVRALRVDGYRPPNGNDYRPRKTAAVLVPFLDLPEPELVLTRRADHLPQHPGQVSFPGGAAEEDDRSAVQTALREAFEEIGLPPELARPIGFLDRMDTISDYRVLPVVALVTPSVCWIGRGTRSSMSKRTAAITRSGRCSGTTTPSGAPPRRC